MVDLYQVNISFGVLYFLREKEREGEKKTRACKLGRQNKNINTINMAEGKTEEGMEKKKVVKKGNIFFEKRKYFMVVYKE